MKRVIVESFLMLLISGLVAATMSPSYIPPFVGAVPVLLGIVLAAVVSLLAIVAALSSPTDLVSLSGKRPADDVEQYQAFIRSARQDIGFVFWSTVVAIVFYILAGVPTPFVGSIPWLNQLAIRLPVFFGVAGLWLSVDATWDILQSLFVLQEGRYSLYKSNKRPD